MALGEFDSSESQHPVSTDHGLSFCTCCNLKIVALEKPVLQLELFKQRRYIYDERSTEASKVNQLHLKNLLSTNKNVDRTQIPRTRIHF